MLSYLRMIFVPAVLLTLFFETSYGVRKGTPDATDVSVVGIERDDAEGDECSGVAIKYDGYGDAGGCVLTARHCATPTPDWVSTGPYVHSTPRHVDLEVELIPNPVTGSYQDLALIWIDGFDGSETWSPRTFEEGCTTNDTVYDIKGFGSVAPNTEPPLGPYRHKGKVRTKDTSNCVEHPTDGKGGYIHAEREGDTIGCPGDSGGPLLDGNVVKGILSQANITNSCSDVTENLVTAFVNGNEDWLEDTIPTLCCAEMSEPCGTGIKCCSGLECNSGSCDTPQ